MVEKEKYIIDEMKKYLQKPAGKKAIKTFLTSFGGINPVLGMANGLIQALDEKNNDEFMKLLMIYLEKSEYNIDEMKKKIDEMYQTNSKESMALLLGEILGDELGSNFLSTKDAGIGIALNPMTHEELKPYEQQGWLTIKPTYSIVLMGAQNRVGNNREELKRPWGQGTTFNIYINDSYFEI